MCARRDTDERVRGSALREGALQNAFVPAYAVRSDPARWKTMMAVSTLVCQSYIWMLAARLSSKRHRCRTRSLLQGTQSYVHLDDVFVRSR